MSPSPWFGAITGIVGCVAGIAGAFIAGINYRRISKMKSLDLRLELRKQTADTAQQLADLPSVLENANASRFEVLGAMGLAQSGAAETWKTQIAGDRALLAKWRADFRAPDDHYKGLAADDLETQLVEMHRLRQKIDQLVQRYKDASAWDARQVDQIREDQRRRSAPSTSR